MNKPSYLLAVLLFFVACGSGDDPYDGLGTEETAFLDETGDGDGDVTSGAEGDGDATGDGDGDGDATGDGDGDGDGDATGDGDGDATGDGDGDGDGDATGDGDGYFFEVVSMSTAGIAGSAPYVYEVWLDDVLAYTSSDAIAGSPGWIFPAGDGFEYQLGVVPRIRFIAVGGGLPGDGVLAEWCPGYDLIAQPWCEPLSQAQLDNGVYSVAVPKVDGLDGGTVTTTFLFSPVGD